MDEVQALFFWADSWLKVKPSTIRNCWEKTKIIDFKFSNDVTYDDLDKLPGASEVVPLDEDIVNSIIDIIPQLPGNTTDSHGHQLISRVDQPELNTNEESLIVCQPSFVEVDTAEEVEEEVTPTEIEDDVVEEDVDTEKTRSELKRAWEVIMLNEVPYNEESHSVIKNCRRRIAEYKLEEIVERKQTDLREYFVSNDRS
ncbi:MAG: hypothetical protein EXX96DRAFT_480481 [Benjaminiella poitrasii]|nr:MAG: hypothetical protein EXX96DRAFT_480481 [Benjaminiella poitrasii]